MHTLTVGSLQHGKQNGSLLETVCDGSNEWPATVCSCLIPFAKCQVCLYWSARGVWLVHAEETETTGISSRSGAHSWMDLRVGEGSPHWSAMPIWNVTRVTCEEAEGSNSDHAVVQCKMATRHQLPGCGIVNKNCACRIPSAGKNCGTNWCHSLPLVCCISLAGWLTARPHGLHLTFRWSAHVTCATCILCVSDVCSICPECYWLVWHVSSMLLLCASCV